MAGKIDAANARGARITTETPFTAGGTAISADVFRNRDWRAIFDIDYEDVQWVPTGEWLDEARFLRYQRDYPASSVNHHYVKETWLLDALKWPDMMVSTDDCPPSTSTSKPTPTLQAPFPIFWGATFVTRSDASDGRPATNHTTARAMVRALI